MTALQKLLDTYRQTAMTEREKGTYFEHLVKAYLNNEPMYKDLFNGKVFLWEEWRAYWMSKGNLDPQTDAGIDLVAVEDVEENPRIFAIQAKFYSEDSKIRKGDGIDSFLSAMGKQPYTNGLLFLTTTKASNHVIEGMKGRDKPVNVISLFDLEASQIDWSQYQPNVAPALKTKKSLRPHQENALNAVKEGLQTADRGKLIMACGTGKTFTGLKIAEELAGKGKRVLFLVPSLSLLSQTLSEWTQESAIPLHSFAVCSDSDVGKKKNSDEDAVQTLMHELQYPATTEPSRLAIEMTKRHDDKHMSVVFSTYHSIDVISKAQQQFNLADFDLIICDEAHRTTGATFENDSESNFVKVHDASFIKSNKRLYMTATPRIYGDGAKVKEEQGGVKLCSMDDEKLYGKELFVINFSEAVSRELLCDYKVIVLTVDAAHISTRLQSLLADENNQLKVDDAAKIVGCWKALSKQSLKEGENNEDGFEGDVDPMRRAVAFCQVIEPNTSKAAKTHKVSSKNIASMFQAVVEAYQEQEPNHNSLVCEAAHVDGSMNASQKEEKLAWLKAQTPDNTCRILSNVRCLSEGVDVPALDAVLFLTPRNSQVDVVQSVGRVMRNAPNKKLGYVILPVVIPSGMSPDEALNDNKTYKVVWEVLQALRSHDDRFDAMINKLDLIGKTNGKMEVISITDNVQPKADKSNSKKKNTGKGQYGIGEKEARYDVEGQLKNQAGLEFEVGEIERALYAKVVKKCGNRNHWVEWANDIAKIANTHITRITSIVSNPANTVEVAKFTAFADELRDDLNDSITNEEVIEMLAQHLITKPVFDALFEGYDFAKSNTISCAMQGVLDVLHEHHLEKEADTLQQFYDSVKMRADGIDNAAGKQKIVVELYDKFFRNAFPRMTERLGIVYTPVEVVDFIIHSVNDILQSEFGQSLGSKDVHIIDPFTGTGTFITRLLQSGLIDKMQLAHKYKNEIHANEIVLLAYYIAAINIEAVYHDIMGADKYESFNGICLTDTFQMYEKEDLISDMLVDNSARRKKQKKLDIRVIMGNPPYSKGQESANDNNQNVSYPDLDGKIRSTYVSRSTATNTNSLYNSYIRAIRWASDRVGNSGVIGFVSGSGFVEKPAMDGLRKCLMDDFSSIYVFNLRGDVRKNMLSKGKAKEGQNIFGSGSMSGIAITLFVKNPSSPLMGKIHYCDIGNDLSTLEKLQKISELKGVAGLSVANLWETITANEHGDWIGQRDDGFVEFISLGDKKDKSNLALFENYSSGLKTGRDSWCYCASSKALANNMEKMIGFYNEEVIKYREICSNFDKPHYPDVDSVIDMDSTKISWNRGLKNDLGRFVKHEFQKTAIVKGLYRPFIKNYVYFSKYMNDMVYQIPQIFPSAQFENLVIAVSGVGARSGFSTLIADQLPNLHLLDTAQVFPLHLYEKSSNDDQIDFDGAPQTGDMFAVKPKSKPKSDSPYTRKDGISDGGLKHFQDAYPSETVSKEDVFYYVYGLLHSPDYRERYADNLSKELPRIPCVKTAKDFWHFSNAGRALAELHLNYETVDCYPVNFEGSKDQLKQFDDADFRVTKMKFAKKGDKTTVVYNHKITMTDIPADAYDYVVNGKPALEWVMERQAVTTHKESGIVNDANDWAIETMGNARYPLELFQRVITVSLETMKIVNALPKLDI